MHEGLSAAYPATALSLGSDLRPYPRPVLPTYRLDQQLPYVPPDRIPFLQQALRPWLSAQATTMTSGPITLVRGFGQPICLELPALASAQERPVRSHADVASAWFVPSGHVRPLVSHEPLESSWSASPFVCRHAIIPHLGCNPMIACGYPMQARTREQ